MKPISTEKAPAAIGPYSQAIRSGTGLVFLSGQLPIDPATGAFPDGGIQEQTRQSILRTRCTPPSLRVPSRPAVPWPSRPSPKEHS